MIKQSIRSFGFGLLAASTALFIYNEIESYEHAELLMNEMIQLLTEKNHTIQETESGSELQTVNTASEVTDVQNQTETKEPSSESVTISVESDMSPNEVAATLKKAGIIQEEEVFKQFLIDNGYREAHNSGSFIFQKGMTHREIAEILIK